MICGQVGCGESSGARALAARHPLIGEPPDRERSFARCYDGNAYIQ